MMPRLIRALAPVLGALFLLAAVPTPAFASTSIRVHTGGLVVPSPEFELVSGGEGMPAIGLLAGFELDENFAVALGLSYSGTRASLFDNHYAGLRLVSLELTAAYHQPLWSALGASVRLGVLGDLGRLQLEVYDGAYDRFRGWAGGFGLVALGGLELRSSIDTRRMDGRERPTGREVRFGLEAGYRWRPGAMPFHALKRKTAREDPDVDRIDLGTIDAGSLRLSSVVIQVSAGISF